MLPTQGTKRSLHNITLRTKETRHFPNGIQKNPKPKKKIIQEKIEIRRIKLIVHRNIAEKIDLSLIFYINSIK